MNLTVITLLLGAAALLAPANRADDSIAAPVDTLVGKVFNDIVITADRGWVEPDGTVVLIPTRHEKNLATDPQSLVKAMHLPMVRDSKGTLTGLSGEPVTFYINGIKATDIDMATFWAKRARKVEYIESPTDPKYQGDRTVINIVVPEDETGGVTRAQLSQHLFTTYGNYSLASKMEHKRFTLGAMASYIDSRNRSLGTRGTDTYRDLFYNGSLHEAIERAFEERGVEKSDYAQFALMGRYKSTRFITTHQLSYRWSRNPGSHTTASDHWTPDIFNSQQSVSGSSARTLSPQLLGTYNYQFNARWHLGATWTYGFTRNNALDRSEIVGLAPVVTRSHEDINSLQFMVMPTFYPNYEMVLQLKARSRISWYDLDYTGTTSAHTRQRRTESSVSALFWWEPVRSLTVSVSPGLSVSAWDIDGYHRNQVQPMADLNLYWTASRKFTANATLNYYNHPPTASESSDVTVRSSELLWLRGNPGLDNCNSWNSMLSCVWLPSDVLNATFRVAYNRTDHNSVVVYEAAPPEMGGLIRSEWNVPAADLYIASIDLTANLLSGDLNLTLSPRFERGAFSGPYARTYRSLTLGASASYSLGNCSFDIDYNSPSSSVSEGGMEKYRVRDELNASLSYGNGDLMLKAECVNIFNKHSRTVSDTLTPHFTQSRFSYDTGRRLKFSVTYFFGYGKKVNKSIDFTGTPDTESSALKK